MIRTLEYLVALIHALRAAPELLRRVNQLERELACLRAIDNELYLTVPGAKTQTRASS